MLAHLENNVGKNNLNFAALKGFISIETKTKFFKVGWTLKPIAEH